MHACAVSLTAGLLTSLLFGTGHARALPNHPAVSRRQTSCASPWQASIAYTGGIVASVNGINYHANWWTQGDNPGTNNGGAGTGQPWTAQGSCGGGSSPSSSNIPSTPVTPSSSALGSGKTNTPFANSAASYFFSPYKDVALGSSGSTIGTQVTGSLVPLLSAVPNIPGVSLAFATGECGDETWGSFAAADVATNTATLNKANVKYIISTGGADGIFTCGTDAGFATFIDRYMSNSLVGIDFDIEGSQTVAQIDALVARVKNAQAKYNRLRFSFTLASSAGNDGSSLNTLGAQVMTSINNAGLTEYYINLMTMNFGNSASVCIFNNGACDMGASAAKAADNLNQNFHVPYSRIELTPMIGGNNTPTNVFTLADVKTVRAYVKQKGLAGLHYWSLDRDTDCTTTVASPTCNNYGHAGTLGFLNAFIS